jgi:hypothetical protein
MTENGIKIRCLTTWLRPNRRERARVSRTLSGTTIGAGQADIWEARIGFSGKIENHAVVVFGESQPKILLAVKRFTRGGQTPAVE